VWASNLTCQSTRTPKGVRPRCGLALVAGYFHVMPHGKGKVTSLHLTSGGRLADAVHFAGGVGVSRLQARAPVGRRAVWPAGRLGAPSSALHQRARHLVPCDITGEGGPSKSRSGLSGWLALTGRHNTSVEMDAPVRPCAARTRLLCATHVQRYAAWKGQSD
jgi:hypothetical protein